MITFKQYLLESLSKPYKWKEVPTEFSSEIARFEFETETGFDYKVRFFSRSFENNPGVEMSWGRASMKFHDTTEKGYDSKNVFKILSTVFVITNKYLEKYKPSSLLMSHIDMKRARIFSSRFKPTSYKLELDRIKTSYRTDTLYVRK